MNHEQNEGKMIKCAVCGKEIQLPKRKYCSPECGRIGQQLRPKPTEYIPIDTEMKMIAEVISEIEKDLHFVAMRKRSCHKYVGFFRILCYVLYQRGFSLVLAARVLKRSRTNLYTHVHNLTEKEKELAKKYITD
jgi:endogenous inhibitor of DNA gyrase (YacG/DUF329 family)